MCPCKYKCTNDKKEAKYLLTIFIPKILKIVQVRKNSQELHKL